MKCFVFDYKYSCTWIIHLNTAPNVLPNPSSKCKEAVVEGHQTKLTPGYHHVGNGAPAVVLGVINLKLDSISVEKTPIQISWSLISLISLSNYFPFDIFLSNCREHSYSDLMNPQILWYPDNSIKLLRERENSYSDLLISQMLWYPDISLLLFSAWSISF